MGKTDKLERQIRETRERLSATVDELRIRANPQRVLSDAAGELTNSTATRFLSNLEADVVSNSLPLTVIAAGISWLMFRPNPRNQPTSENPYVSVFHWLSRMTSAARENASRAGSTVQSGAASAQGRISSISQQAAQTVNAISQSAQSTTAAATQALASTAEAARGRAEVVRNSASSAAKTVSTTARGTARTVENHPTLVAGTALAIGGAAALVFFLGRSVRDEVARLKQPDPTPRPITPERALALVDESALSLIPSQGEMELNQQKSGFEAKRTLENLNGF